MNWAPAPEFTYGYETKERGYPGGAAPPLPCIDCIIKLEGEPPVDMDMKRGYGCCMPAGRYGLLVTLAKGCEWP